MGEVFGSGKAAYHGAGAGADASGAGLLSVAISTADSCYDYWVRVLHKALESGYEPPKNVRLIGL